MRHLKTWQLFAVCVLTWGTTWYAITFQIGLASPEASVAARFGLAGALVLAVCAARGQPLRFGWRTHARFALQGAFLYGVSYLCVYHAERHVVSGLVAVGYSASPLAAGLGARWLFGTAMAPRFVAGGGLGLAGVALIFWPAFLQAAGGTGFLLGAGFTLASVLLSTVGSLAASRNRRHGLPFWPSLGWGMLYGAAVCVPFAVAQGGLSLPPLTAGAWWAALLYLALAGSILTFACFLTLLDRIGAGPAGAVGVMTPLLALGVSVAFESFRPDAYTLAGVVLAVIGNRLMLAEPRRPALAPAVT